MSKPPYYIASCSFGKDSLATILLALEHGEPLDEVVSVEVMFDNKRGITGENPEHWNWVKSVAVPRLEAMGLKVTILHSDYDMVSIFNKVRGTRSKYTGKKNGFMMGLRCQGNKLFKMRPLDRYKREMEKMFNVVYYVGIAKDEKKRLARLDGINNISLLDKYGYTEDMAKELCIKNNLLSPVYQITTRGGCWFCPNKNYYESQQFRKAHPDMWAELEKLDKEENRVSANFKYTKTLKEVNKILDGMDMQLELNFEY